jgi:PIN domain nuclease of toxin-antitoxin system
MNLLLDTHVFIWWDSSPDQLSSSALEVCKSPNNHLFLSLASIWEMQIKLQLGKLKFNLPLEQIIETQVRSNDLNLLQISLNHVYTLGRLPAPHKDPFDRLIVAQAIVENYTLITADATLHTYPVPILW